jgi:hypothetical protein
LLNWLFFNRGSVPYVVVNFMSVLFSNLINLLVLIDNSESSFLSRFNLLNGLQFSETQESFLPCLALEPTPVSLQFILVPTNVNSALPQTVRSIRNHVRFSPRHIDRSD